MAGPLSTSYNHVVPDGPEDRWRVRAVTVGICLILTAALGLITSVYIVRTVSSTVRKQVEDKALQDTVNLCLTQRAGRENENRLRFALRELLAFDTDIIRSAQANQQTAQQRRQTQAFIAMELDRLNVDLAKERAVTPGLPKHLDGYAELQPFLESIPEVFCSTRP